MMLLKAVLCSTKELKNRAILNLEQYLYALHCYERWTDTSISADTKKYQYQSLNEPHHVRSTIKSVFLLA